MDTLDRAEIDAFLDAQAVGRLGCHDGAQTYVVPLIYARDGDALYVLTMLGRKVRTMRANPSVCFEVDTYDAGTGNWTSVIVQGRFEELAAPDEKARALAILGKRHGTRRGKSEGGAGAAAPPEIVAFRVRIESASGRAVRRAEG